MVTAMMTMTMEKLTTVILTNWPNGSPEFLVSCWPATRYSGKTLHCCRQSLFHKQCKNFKGLLQVNLPCTVMGGWTEVFSSPLASGWSPGQFQTRCLSPALSFLIFCRPLASCSIEQPECKSNPILAGSQGAHGAVSSEDVWWERETDPI